MSIVSNVPTYDGTSLVQITGNQPRVVLRVIRGLVEGPEVRGVDNVIPSLPGRVARNRVADRRVIELEGFIAGTGSTISAQLADMVDIYDEMEALFDPTKTPDTLSVVREDGSTRSILARPLNYAYGDDTIPTFRTMSVELESVVPDWTDGGS